MIVTPKPKPPFKDAGHTVMKLVLTSPPTPKLVSRLPSTPFNCMTPQLKVEAVKLNKEPRATIWADEPIATA